MRVLFCSLHVVIGLALGLRGCGKEEVSRTPSPPAPGLSPGLPIGRPALEIAGEDIDGVPFRLSAYRGKVVVLAFWGNW